MLARGQGEGEEVFAAVHDERCGTGFLFLYFWIWIPDDGWRWCDRVDDEFVVMPPDGLAVFNEEGLLIDGRGEVAELGTGELEENGRLWALLRQGFGGHAAPTLEEREGGEQIGRRLAALLRQGFGGQGGEVEFHLERDRVARGGGGEIGRQVEAEHGVRK
jgi:hypothetical protein